MKYRKLVNGQKVACNKDAEDTKLTISTKCPKKWAFVDMETGHIWVSKTRYPKYTKSQYDFYSADPKALKCINEIIAKYYEKN